MNRIIVITFGALIILTEVNSKERIKENNDVKIDKVYKLSKVDAG